MRNNLVEGTKKTKDESTSGGVIKHDTKRIKTIPFTTKNQLTCVLFFDLTKYNIRLIKTPIVNSVKMNNNSTLPRLVLNLIF